MVFDLGPDYIGQALDPIQALLIGGASLVARSVVVAGRFVVEEGQIPGFDMRAAHEQAQAQFAGLVRRYPDRTWGHPPVEAIFSTAYPVVSGHTAPAR